ncbi:MAG TPA: DNA polymerase III subunit delta [Longimicrobiaceae bacterium]|nr:DNA polymerase III subunit delta [Longimicrobiaceae bacterium]
MPELAYEALERTLRNRVPGGAFFFHGEEEFLREEAVGKVVAAYLDDSTRDFNFDQLRGAEVAGEALASVLATPPMLAEWRVVVVRDAQGLAQKARDTVEAAAAAPPAGLILVVSAAIPAGTKAKFYDTLKRAAVSVEFAPLGPDEAPEWLMETARTVHGVELEPAAARAVAAALGVELGMLASELRKLAAYVQDRGRITIDDVKAVGGSIPRQDRWAWFDLVAERRCGEALATLPVLLEAGENGVGLVIGMAGQLLKVGLVCAGGQAALERELKPFQRWMSRRVVPQARRWTLDELDAALAELLRTDRLLKSASLTDRQALEELLLRLHAIGPAARSAA